MKHKSEDSLCQYLSRFKCKRFEFFPKKVKFLNLKSIDLCPMARLTKEELLCMVGDSVSVGILEKVKSPHPTHPVAVHENHKVGK